MTMKHKGQSTCAEVKCSPGCIWGNLLVVSLHFVYHINIHSLLGIKDLGGVMQIIPYLISGVQGTEDKR